MFGRGVAVNPELLAFPQGTQMSLKLQQVTLRIRRDPVYCVSEAMYLA